MSVERSLGVGGSHTVHRLLLSHHPPEHMDRTITIGLGGSRVRVCARCSGIAAGMLALCIAAYAGWLPPIPSHVCLAVVSACALPAILDFHLQMMGVSKSNNLRRILTGMLFGTALALCVRQILCGSLIALSFMPLILCLYFSLVAHRRNRVMRMVEHLQLYLDYYERCRAEDARASVMRAANAHIEMQREA